MSLICLIGDADCLMLDGEVDKMEGLKTMDFRFGLLLLGEYPPSGAAFSLFPSITATGGLELFTFIADDVD